MKFLTIALLSFVSLLFLDCNSGVQTRTLLYRSNEFAAYTVKRENIKLKTEDNLDKTFAHPYEISEEKILDLLGNLRYKQESSYGNLNLNVFEEEEIREIASDLTDALRNIKPEQLLLVISKYNHLKSVVSHYVRTGFYIWSTENTVEILFGEIHKEIPFDEQGNFFDWSRIPEISFDNTADSNFVILNSSFTFKQLDGFKNKRWLVFKKSELSRIKFEKRKSKPKVSNPPEGDVTPEKRIDRDDADAVIQD